MLLVFYAKSQWKVGFLQSLCLYFDENNGGNYNYDDGDNNNDNDNYDGDNNDDGNDDGDDNDKMVFLEYRTQMLGSFNLEYLKDWHQRIGDPKGEEEREEVRMVMDLLCVILMSMSVLHNLVLLVMVDNNIGHLVKRVGDL
ncbi:hypothetical protein GLOIN_2v1772314 [Rhizophagus irregularis DAOM 181602=DAOM 197198]|uniref:Uncharacterized protein n=1 Tax=Rhizophagus irregularis (strain DAOM 181602 / DAOM 197198 / MUCL 43194) TaxID=747089 RepID=A0A2P4Q7N2_RHIID|nr:hypothetical protein GLOIN_2v1772314 [Rhizophagus irregularis DAOM 181602=DAOM 197198]POG73651.1 hypothetical protein GLOIN_2v1772314 [Rhizophagus irregularis DAOM 181602=DAOM 197198]GET50050.1 hypothetical protein GLOIN_2v1772314 [Rhizophagus irregularis DAOM 181602=DAOM 197198]|eukprot:XP_025180517.1 hypothetical protein GLOIN_2v1772314 [Rhizophagus irregularis DAOM 181602=DAOM 197198]